jgi:hypothetical protein
MAERGGPPRDFSETAGAALPKPSRLEARPPTASSAAAGSYGEYDENGVDLSLLRYLLQLSPLERLRRMEQHARDTLILYEYGRRHREAAAGGHR